MELTDDPIDVFRNDEIELSMVDQYDLIVLSPGPGLPASAGIMPQLIKKYADSKVIFGVCLGLQAIGEAFGGNLINLSQVFHGIDTDITVTDQSHSIYEKLPKKIRVGRYHSWVVDKSTLPNELIVTAVDDKGMIMSLQHKKYHVSGVQYHPESIMTEEGKSILRNLLSYAESVMKQQASVTQS
jgi:anthranilate synthase component 2